MTATGKTIYLASKSPRRRELLSQVGIVFQILELSEGAQGEVDETPHTGEPPHDYVVRVARIKAHAGWARVRQQGLAPRPVLAADTTVALNGAILGKPAHADEASAMLRALSGRKHFVHTAVTVKNEDRLEQDVSTTEVQFRDLAEDEISRYVASGEPMDKAGGYGIQGPAAGFVANLSGSYSGVVGLPLFETLVLLKQFGVIIP